MKKNNPLLQVDSSKCRSASQLTSIDIHDLNTIVKHSDDEGDYVRPNRRLSSTDCKPYLSLAPISGFPEHLPNHRLVELDLIDVIRTQYELHGFTPIETPAVERLDVLMSKGDMGRQIFSVGRAADDTEEHHLGLHFDLTVPLARYVVQHAEKLTFPFRRYQIQKVWRGERAQEARYKEFYQCDIDIIGSGKLDFIHDAEIAAVIASVFTALRLKDYYIHVSNLKIINEFTSHFGLDDAQTKAIRDILDRSKKEGLEQCLHTVLGLVSNRDFLTGLKELVFAANFDDIAAIFARLKIESAGLDELREVISAAVVLGCPKDKLVVDLTICRGLDYYTGTVFETFLQGENLSICSGGRYDQLAAYFSERQYPGVGISIGLSRLMAILLKRRTIEAASSTPTYVLVTMQDRTKHRSAYLQIARDLRQKGIPTEVFLEDKPLRDQIGYAAALGIPFVIIAGDSELNKRVIQVKDMRNRTMTYVQNHELKDFFLDRYRTTGFRHIHQL